MSRFSTVLPGNVLVTNFRLSDGGVDFTMRSEAESLNIPEILRPLKTWKVEQIQQRRRNNDAASVITLKLVSVEGEE